MKKLLSLTVVIAVMFIGCKDAYKHERIIPEQPFIVIDYEPYKYQTTETGIKYKTIDKNGYVFYFSEPLPYETSPRYNLGDTIKK